MRDPSEHPADLRAIGQIVRGTDLAEALAAAVRAAFARGPPALPRSAQVERYLQRLATIDPEQPLDGQPLRALWNGEIAS